MAVVKKPGAEVTREELLKFYEGKTAKWQIPDDVVFVEAIPLGATGKILKTKLREQLQGLQAAGGLTAQLRRRRTCRLCDSEACALTGNP